LFPEFFEAAGEGFFLFAVQQSLAQFILLGRRKAGWVGFMTLGESRHHECAVNLVDLRCRARFLGQGEGGFGKILGIAQFRHESAVATAEKAGFLDRLALLPSQVATSSEEWKS